MVSSDWIQKIAGKVEEIQHNMLTAQSRQKSYADKRRRDMKFVVGDQVLLKVSPTKGVMPFEWRETLV